MTSIRTPLEVWSPLPPQESGVADYVNEQIEFLDSRFDLTLVVEDATRIEDSLRKRFRLVSKAGADPGKLRLYHVGNSPLHAFIYLEALRVPGVVVLHEWNLHELILGFAVRANDFSAYRAHMRREHGARGSVAAQTIASALGGRHWTGVFALNAEILERALAIVCLSEATAAAVAGRAPETPLLHLPHHALLKSHAANRREARRLLGLAPEAQVILAPGLGTASKSLSVVRDAVDLVSARRAHALLVTVGGGDAGSTDAASPRERSLGRVDLETLGDALLAADVVVALRFPSRGETSGVVMRALACGRAVVVSTGSTADRDFLQGVVARINPGPNESRELAATLGFLLDDDEARGRLERLSLALSSGRKVESLCFRLSDFLQQIGERREELTARMAAARETRGAASSGIRDDLEAAARSLGLARLPASVYERFAGL